MKNRPKQKKLVLGVTGSLGSGKTSVSGIFKKLGASVIDADAVYAQLIKPPSRLYKKIISAFGKEILGKDKKIERKKLAGLIFANPRNLKRLAQITHPAIIRKIRQKLDKLKEMKGRRILIIDAPLLIEAGLVNIIDKLIVVKIKRKNQIKRIQKQRRMPQTEIIQRIKAQLPLREKVKLADYVIDNNGRLKQMTKQVEKIWQELKLDIL